MELGTIDVEATSVQRWYIVRLSLDSLTAIAAKNLLANTFSHTHSYTVQR